MKYYLAYGSNLNKAQMAFRCPDAVPIGKSRINNYELAFRRGVLTIEPSIGEYVPVGVWMISEDDEKSLDRYEGFPRLYRKEIFPILISKKDHGVTIDEYVDAMVYIMNSGHGLDVPSLAYMRTCTKGYEDFGMDPGPLIVARTKVVKATEGGDKA